MASKKSKKILVIMSLSILIIQFILPVALYTLVTLHDVSVELWNDAIAKIGTLKW